MEEGVSPDTALQPLVSTSVCSTSPPLQPLHEGCAESLPSQRSPTRSSCYRGFYTERSRGNFTSWKVQWCLQGLLLAAWAIHHRPCHKTSLMKSIKVFNLSSLVQNSTYFALAPDSSCGMILRVDRAAVLHQRSTMAELSCVQVCTAPVMSIITQVISSCLPVCLQGMSPLTCLSSGLPPALCRHCHQKGAIKTHKVGQQGDSKSRARSFPLPGNVKWNFCPSRIWAAGFPQWLWVLNTAKHCRWASLSQFTLLFLLLSA